MKSKNSPSLDLLEELRGHLSGIEELFPGRTVFAPESEEEPKQKTKAEQEESDEDSTDDTQDETTTTENDEDYSDGSGSSADAEEIEVAVDELLSEINKKRDKKRKAKSLSELFGLLFGKRDEIVDTAEMFEDSINGYFGQLFGDDLRNAQDYLDELIDYVKERIAQCKP